MTPRALPGPVGALSVWRHGCQEDGALRVALARDLSDGILLTGSALESVSCDGKPGIVALLSTDSGPEGHGPHRIQRARWLLVFLRDPSVRLLFRTAGEGQFYPPGSDSDRSAERTASVCFLNPINGGVGRPWTRLASLAEYAALEDVTPNTSGLIQVDRPLGGLGVRLCIYRRELNGITVYQAFLAWPGPPGARSGLRTGDMIRAVSCSRTEGVLLGYGDTAVAVCLLGPGSAGPVPERRCIASLQGLAEALAAPGAVACFARGSPVLPPTEDGRAPAWLLMRSDHPRDLTTRTAYCGSPRPRRRPSGAPPQGPNLRRCPSHNGHLLSSRSPLLGALEQPRDRQGVVPNEGPQAPAYPATFDASDEGAQRRTLGRPPPVLGPAEAPRLHGTSGEFAGNEAPPASSPSSS